MKADSRITHFATRQDYLKKSGTTAVSKTPKNIPDSVEVVAEGEVAKNAKKQPSLKDETKKAAKHLKDDAIKTAKTSGLSNMFSGFLGGLFSSGPRVPTVEINTSSQINAAESTKELANEAHGKLKPGIFMLTGFEFGGLSDDDSGVAEMAKFIPGAQSFKWDQEDKVFQEISKLNKNAAVILVGHSLGGDAVVNLANRLNSLEGGYRKVDLLVTLDSVGFDNDIIPRNVKQNLNFIGDRDMLFNDGPNIARNSQSTHVFNELRSEDHMGIDDAEDVQFKIFEEINEVLKGHEDQLKVENQQRGLKLMAKNLSKLIGNPSTDTARLKSLIEKV